MVILNAECEKCIRLITGSCKGKEDRKPCLAFLDRGDKDEIQKDNN